MLRAEALEQFDLLEKCESCQQAQASVALTGKPTLGPEDVFS